MIRQEAATASTTSRPGDTSPEPVQERAALSPEVSHFLVQLSIALHKTGTYPEDHPALTAAIQALALRLERLLAIRQSVQIGVGRDRLLIEGGATDPANAVLRSLAEALHRHQIASIRFNRGASSAEVASLLTELSTDGRRTTPLGARDDENLAHWPNIRIAPVSVDHLALSTSGADGTALDGLWLLLAQATLQTDGEAVASERTSADLAAAIRRNVADSSYDRVITDYMSRVGEELNRDGTGSSNVALQLGELIDSVGEETLGMLLDLGSDMVERHKLVRDLSRVLPAGSVVALTQAAANASRETISHSLLRLFAKLAANAEAEPGHVSMASDLALRDAISQLVDDWTLADPNPDVYRDVLRELSSSQRTSTSMPAHESWTDSARLIDIALETDAVGPAVWRAVNELVGLGRLDDLLDTLARADHAPAARKIRAHLGKPEQIGALLQSRQSREAVEQLLRWTDVEAADALLDGLAATDSRGARRSIIERLAQMGDAIGEKIIDRLDHGAWFVQRNMLYLLSELEDVPAGFDPGPWLAHEDRRVRREAIRVGLRVPQSRVAAIRAGVAENDTRVLILALGAAADECPSDIAPRLIEILDDPATDPSVRLSAVRALGRTGAGLARRWLLHRVVERSGLLRRPALARKSHEVLIALSALRQWRTHRDVAAALELARNSDDVDVRFAAMAASPGWP